MCTTHPSSVSSSMYLMRNNTNEVEDSSDYFDNMSEKDKDEIFYTEPESFSQDNNNIIERSDEGHFGKVNNFLKNFLKFL